jgi:hypothetical protein
MLSFPQPITQIRAPRVRPRYSARALTVFSCHVAFQTRVVLRCTWTGRDSSGQRAVCTNPCVALADTGIMSEHCGCVVATTRVFFRHSTRPLPRAALSSRWRACVQVPCNALCVPRPHCGGVPINQTQHRQRRRRVREPLRAAARWPAARGCGLRRQRAGACRVANARLSQAPPCRVVLLVCCAVLCCAVLCCAVLCCAVLCCAVLCCAVLCCDVMWYAVV